MANPEFDFQRLSDITGRDPAFEGELLGEFLHSTADLLEQQRAHLQTGDVAELGRTAHALRGASLTLGATGLGQLEQEIEACAREHRLQDAIARVDRALSEFAALKTLLETHIKRLAA